MQLQNSTEDAAVSAGLLVLEEIKVFREAESKFRNISLFIGLC
jgi:hypothetical protein